MSKKKDSDISEEDKQLFRDAVSGSQPVNKGRRAVSERPKPTQRRRQTDISDDDGPNYRDIGGLVAPVTAEQSLFFARSGVNNRQLKLLRQGRYQPEAHLDLHGLNMEQADRQLLEFLQYSQDQGYRVVLVIHGKGQGANNKHPKMKNRVNRILHQHPTVLAYCSCMPQHGGRGAVYVLLKRVAE